METTEDTRDFLDDILDRRTVLADAREEALRVFESRFVKRLLAIHGDDTARAAAASGIGERYLRMIRARVRRADGSD